MVGLCSPSSKRAPRLYAGKEAGHAVRPGTIGFAHPTGQWPPRMRGRPVGGYCDPSVSAACDAGSLSSSLRRILAARSAAVFAVSW